MQASFQSRGLMAPQRTRGLSLPNNVKYDVERTTRERLSAGGGSSGGDFLSGLSDVVLKKLVMLAIVAAGVGFGVNQLASGLHTLVMLAGVVGVLYVLLTGWRPKGRA